MPLKTKLRPIIHKIRVKTVGENWRNNIRPIAWYNLPFWIWETIREDRRFYQHAPRPWSSSRIWHLWSPNLNNPIFIIGAPRSGTTFLGECLGTDPNISYHFEPILTKAATRYVHEGLWSDRFAQWYYRAVYGWLMRLHFDADLCFAEKTPQISLIIPFLQQTFPQARFIHIIRDGRDAALSLSKKPWYKKEMNGSGAKEPDGYPFGSKARFWVEAARIDEYETTNDLHRCIWLWRRYLESILDAVPQIPQDHYYELRYEALVQDTEVEAERLINFLGITQPESRTKLKETFIKQANPQSVGNGKRQLTNEQIAVMEQEAGSLLDTLNYISKNCAV